MHSWRKHFIQLANGDRISTKDLKFGIVSGGKYDTGLKENQAKHEGAVSADAGTYWGELTHTGGGITHEDGTDAYKNYKVTVEGDIIVTPADFHFNHCGSFHRIAFLPKKESPA